MAIPGAIEFDDLLDKVLAISPEMWVQDIEHAVSTRSPLEGGAHAR